MNSTSKSDLTWTPHFDTLVRKVKQRLYQLRQLKKFRVSRRLLQTFYTSAVESILTGSIPAWFSNSSSKGKRALQRVVVRLSAVLALNSPPCRTCTPGGVEQSLQDHEGSSPPQQTFPTAAVRQGHPQSHCKNRD